MVNKVDDKSVMTKECLTFSYGSLIDIDEGNSKKKYMNSRECNLVSNTYIYQITKGCLTIITQIQVRI